MKDAKTIVGENIRRLRKNSNWSQEDLAGKCGLHRTYIGAI
jgi:transcriptional regulator with XRE-family HTH domain